VSDEDRAKLRQECHAMQNALRGTEIPEPAFRLFEIIIARLDRLETGSFSQYESPTEPERKPSSAKWSNEGVIKALEEGRKKEEEE